MAVAVVTPTYNEAANIASLIPTLMGLRDDIDVIVVDDNSPDGTADVVREHSSSWPTRVHLIERPGKQGLGTAYVAGFTYALARGYDYVIQLDSDGSHQPAHIPSMVAKLEQGYDMVIGSRYVPGGSAEGLDGASRRILSRCANFYVRTVTGISVRDATGGFRAYRAPVLARVPWHTMQTKGFGFMVVTLHAMAHLGARITEVPIDFRPRAAGESKMDTAIMFEGLRTVWALRA